MEEVIANYKIQALAEVSFCIKKRPDNFIGDGNFFFEMSFNQSVSEEKKLLLAVVKIVGRELNGTENLVEYELGCGFEILNFSEAIKKQGDKYDVLDRLSTIANSIAISTARGCLYEKLRGTYLQAMVLPVVMMDSVKMVKL